MNTRYLLAFLFFIKMLSPVFGQLDTIHWCPPMHARTDEGPQYLYLSTPEKTAFPVEVRDGSGKLLTTLSLSNTQPQEYYLGGSNNSVVLVSENQLQTAIQGKGLVISGSKKFYAYLRAHASSQFHACDLTCKGKAALGKIFRIGHVLQAVHEQARRANFVGMMATEDSTEITLSEYDPNTKLRVAGADLSPGDSVKMLLMKGESLVFSNYISDDANQTPPNGLMGALLKSTKPIAVNCGTWIGAPVEAQAHDIGVDQIAPIEQVGKEYILCKGNGGKTLEHPMVIAHFPNTKVWLNGKTNPAAVLNPGEVFVAGAFDFSAEGNMFIKCSEPVFLYQMIGGVPSGNDEPRTAGLIFVPPVSCAIPNAVDNIYKPNTIGSMRFEGGLMVVAMRDSLVTVRLDGTVVNLGSSSAVPGYDDFVTYRKLDIWDENDNPQILSVVAEGPVQVAMYGRNEPASFAAFFSGFSKEAKPIIDLTLTGDGVCPDTLLASGRFDGVQWMYEDSILQFGKDTFFVAYAPGKYTAIGYLGVCRRTDFAEDSISAVFRSPEFPFSSEQPTCFEFLDGQINIGQPTGGIAPYHFSINNGQSFSQNPTFTGLAAGDYKLVVRDSTGCYNRPLTLEIGQPDSFSVEIVPRRLPDPLKPGMEVVLEGMPERPISLANWWPSDSSDCGDCLEYIFHPISDSWVALTVFDTAGCPAVDSIFLVVEPNIFAPNVIHAGNNLTQNDRFFLQSADPQQIVKMRIFDRWGEMVFENKNLKTNDAAAGWDGFFRGEMCLPGVYVWVAEVEISGGKRLVLRGDLTVVR